MTEKISGAITSDKVETDNTNFATVKADQTCEEVLIPRDNPFRQLNWQVTLEKGAVYNPQEDIGIYAEEIDCKYGVQIQGDLFGRNAVSFEYGGAAHDADGEDRIGTRVFGSVFSEGRIEVVDAESTMDDWEERPVIVYGDVVGTHISIDEPAIIFGSVNAEKTFRANAETIILGELHSDGLIEASDLFAYSVTARNDITLGAHVATINPAITSEEGSIIIAEEVGIFVPEIIDRIRDGNDVEGVGPWILDVEAGWENRLLPEDVLTIDGAEVATRAWRTAEEPEDVYRRSRELFAELVAETRKSPPDIEEFRYAGLSSIDGGQDISIEGDMVLGEQTKSVEATSITEIDQSSTQIEQTTEVHDESTTVQDSVVNRSDIGGGDEKDEENG